MRTEVGATGTIRQGKMAVGLQPENAIVPHSVERVCPVREIKSLDLTRMEVGLSGRIRPGQMAVDLGAESVTILHSVELDCPVRENQPGKVKNVLQVIRPE